MPTLHIRAVPSELMARLKASAREADEPVDQHALRVLQDGLTIREARRAGGKARAASMTAKQRSESARRAVTARHAERNQDSNG